jgi:hypothetical protein
VSNAMSKAKYVFRGYIVFDDGSEMLTRIVSTKEAALKDAAKEIGNHPGWKLSIIEYGDQKENRERAK